MEYNDTLMNIGVMSPLADPIVAEIFKDETIGGLAAESFINAVLSEGGEVFGEVTKLVAQRPEKALGQRGCIIDVYAVSNLNNKAIIEAQLYFDPTILQRDLLEASYLFRDSTQPGTSAAEMVRRLPIIYAINILGNDRNCRTDNRELLQPIHNTYDKPPHKIALSQFAAFDIQLPYFNEEKINFDSPLYCWCYLLYEMHFHKKSIGEVFTMEAMVKDFFTQDRGAKQFVTNYTAAVANPAMEREYRDWLKLTIRENGIIADAVAEKDKIIAEKDAQINRIAAEKDAQIDRIAAEKDRIAAEKDRIAAEKDRIAAEKDRIAAEKDARIAELERLLNTQK
jgi:hypothetical protein